MLFLVLKGIGYGLIMALMLGPVFFTLIRTSIDKDFFSGALLAVGIALSEGIIITISYLGVAIIEKNYTVRLLMSIAGGGIMLALGSFYVFRSSDNDTKSQGKVLKNNSQKIRYILEGFILNILNPPLYILWIGVIGNEVLDNDYNYIQVSILFSITIITIFLTDLLKAYLADKISNFLDSKTLVLVDKGIGVVLFGFGFYLLYFGVFGI